MSRSSIPKSVRDAVWAKYIGMNKAEGKCYVCVRPIHITDFEVGHNKAVAKGGSNHITNLRPICKGCNRSMGTMPIEAYKKIYFSEVKIRQSHRCKLPAKGRFIWCEHKKTGKHCLEWMGKKCPNLIKHTG